MNKKSYNKNRVLACVFAGGRSLGLVVLDQQALLRFELVRFRSRMSFEDKARQTASHLQMAIGDDDPSCIVLEREEEARGRYQAQGLATLVRKLAKAHRLPVKDLCRAAAWRFICGTGKKTTDAQVAQALVGRYPELQEELGHLTPGLISSRQRDLKPLVVALALALTTIYVKNIS